MAKNKKDKQTPKTPVKQKVKTVTAVPVALPYRVDSGLRDLYITRAVTHELVGFQVPEKSVNQFMIPWQSLATACFYAGKSHATNPLLPYSVVHDYRRVTKGKVTVRVCSATVTVLTLPAWNDELVRTARQNPAAKRFVAGTTPKSIEVNVDACGDGRFTNIISPAEGHTLVIVETAESQNIELGLSRTIELCPKPEMVGVISLQKIKVPNALYPPLEPFSPSNSGALK